MASSTIAREALAAADGRINTFEFMLRYLILRNLEPRFEPCRVRPVQIFGIRGVRQKCSCILSTMARVGQRDEGRAKAAFDEGAGVLYEKKVAFSFLPASQCGVSVLGSPLAKLADASAQIKRRLLAACLKCLSHDGAVEVGEIELFRAVADALGCPVPPGWIFAGRPARRPSPPKQGSV